MKKKLTWKIHPRKLLMEQPLFKHKKKLLKSKQLKNHKNKNFNRLKKWLMQQQKE